MTYNGHKNYETWVTSMYLDGNYDNGEATYHEVRALAREADGVESLVEQLREFVSERIGCSGSGLGSDIIGAALRDVDWEALADALHDEVAEEDDEE